MSDNYREAYSFLNLDYADIENDLKKQEYLNSLKKDIQGNILKSHGRNFSVCLFLNFGNSPFDSSQQKIIKKWISDFAEKNITSSLDQDQHSQGYRTALQQQVDPPPKLFVNFSLSLLGYIALGLEQPIETFRKLHEQKINDRESSLPSLHPFENGMQKRRKQIGDRAMDWESGYKKNDIHALILLADDYSDHLWEQANQIITEIKNIKAIKIVKKEVGCIRRNMLEQTIEPFGFADGISQPLFLTKADSQDTKWNPCANLRLVLNVDPYGKNFQDAATNTPYSFGSFLVYRKLEQDVAKFNTQITDLATEYQKNVGTQSLSEAEQLIKALAVGRFQEDGRPVAIYPSPNAAEEKGVDLNDFNYGVGEEFTETSRWKCPFHSHIRKTNSRAQTDNVYSLGNSYNDSPANQRLRRITRRGTSYGLPKDEAKVLLSEATKKILQDYQTLAKKLGIKLAAEGTLFFCFQSDILAQFEKLQEYANDPDFGPLEGGNLGIDPITGSNINKKALPKQTWPSQWGSDQKPVTEGFWGAVTPKGGEYFFTPSLSFLRSLSKL
jgi:deferrochelatase/peroxidase EfeB